MQNLEIEYKVLVNKEDYEKLICFITQFDYHKFDQTNYYFDDRNDNLLKNKISLRIRYYSDSNKYILTLKEKKEEGHLEHEFEMPSNDILLANNEIKSIVNQTGASVNDLILLTSLRTIRYEISYQDSLLCVDHSFYNGLEDYEVECEANTMDTAKEVIKEVLDNLSINYEESKNSKQKRAKLSIKK